MALARIISRSQKCWRDLALDLLARGYAVEVVHPDRIPEGIADLEFRVDDSETVKPPQSEASADIPENIVVFDGEPALTSEVELPGTTSDRASQASAPASNFLLDVEESARLITPMNPALETLPLIPASGLLSSNPWLLRAAASFAALVALAALLATGIYRGSTESLAGSSYIESRDAAGAKEWNALTAPPPLTTGPAITDNVAAEQDKHGRIPKTAGAKRGLLSQREAPLESSLHTADRLGVGETAVFRDKPLGNSVNHKSHYNREEDIVAKDTVTYFDAAVIPRSRLR